MAAEKMTGEVSLWYEEKTDMYRAVRINEHRREKIEASSFYDFKEQLKDFIQEGDTIVIQDQEGFIPRETLDNIFNGKDK